ncbi:MAG: phage holin family protein [Actinomycetota bacterium]
MAERVRTEDIYRTNGTGSEKSAGQLVKEVTEDLSTLVRKEIELAKQELGASIAEKLKGAAILVVIAVIGFFMLIFLLLAIRDAFTEIWAPWISDLATVGVLAIVSAGAALVAKKKLSTPLSTELTKKSVKEDVELMKSLGKR